LSISRYDSVDTSELCVQQIDLVKTLKKGGVADEERKRFSTGLIADYAFISRGIRGGVPV